MYDDLTKLEETTEEFKTKILKLHENTQNVLMSDTVWEDMAAQKERSVKILTEILTLLEK